MPKRPRVSVCIPVRNGAGQLQHTFRNLIERTAYPIDNFEVIVGNHGSTDATADILREWCGKFAGLKVVDVPWTSANRSLVRNRMIDASSGEVIVFIDHDILVPPNFVGEHARLHDAQPSSLIAGMTYGKGIFAQQLGDFVAKLDLDNIGAAESTLAARPEMADSRTHPEMMQAGSGDALVELKAQLVPARLCWTCNVSVERKDIDACGRFDEWYDSWGVEDDDFAQQFLVKDKGMLFSRDAWAFHVPHAFDMWTSIVSWRKNFDYFFSKYANRELEYFGVYTTQVTSANRQLMGTVLLLGMIDVTSTVHALGARLPAPTGRRFAHFMMNSTNAKALALTDAFDPTLPARERSVDRNGMQVWPFFGLKTPFDKGTFADAVIVVDIAMLLERHHLTVLLAETARTAGKVYLGYGPGTRDPKNAAAVAVFDEVADGIRFGDREVISLP
jgi:glycosyltransferase involved in cell wall biosynthesis